MVSHLRATEFYTVATTNTRAKVEVCLPKKKSDAAFANSRTAGRTRQQTFFFCLGEVSWELVTFCRIAVSYRIDEGKRGWAQRCGAQNAGGREREAPESKDATDRNR